MGGKKKKAVAPEKKESKFRIPVNFDCPLCDAKASIKVHMKLSDLVATVTCRTCKLPNPPFTARLNKLSKPQDAFFDFYEDLRSKDEENLREHHIDLVATELNRVEQAAAIMSPGAAMGLLPDASAVEFVPADRDADVDDFANLPLAFGEVAYAS
jgi:transcription elongation factor Elf1